MDKKSNNIKFKIVLSFMACMLFAPYTFASAEIIETEDIPKVNISQVQTYSNLMAEKRLLATTSFDLRNTIKIPIENQYTTNSCWAFANNTVIETNLALRNNEIYDFSERHMVYATSKTFTDGINSLGYNKEAAQGGNSALAMAYYTSGRGPILESEMPFSISEGKISLSAIENKTVQKKIADYAIFTSVLKSKDTAGNISYTNPSDNISYTEEEVNIIRNSIKNHIMTYGAVTTMTLSGSSYDSYYNYNLDYPAFYCDDSSYEPNHQVAIIGWDDNYPVENFNANNRPSKPGAYLVMNSYGTEKYKYGCFYISYEDCFVETNVVGVINVEDIDYENIYQHDVLGLSSNLCLGEESEIYGANVFSKDKTSIEILNEIGISSSFEQDIELYINPTDGELKEEKLQKVETEVSTVRAGYTTVKLKTPIILTVEKFAVAVKYIGKNQKAYIGVEVPNIDYWQTATSNSGESYYSVDCTNWVDLLTDDIINANICIKAFTDIKGYNITSDLYRVEDELIYKISPKTTIEEFKQNIQTVGSIKILKDNIELQNDDIISTGATINVGENKTYNVIVKGDITGTGELTSTDISQVGLHIIKLKDLTEIQKKAADLNGTGTITLTDLSQMQMAIVGLIKI